MALKWILIHSNCKNTRQIKQFVTELATLHTD